MNDSINNPSTHGQWGLARDAQRLIHKQVADLSAADLPAANPRLPMLHSIILF